MEEKEPTPSPRQDRTAPAEEPETTARVESSLPTKRAAPAGGKGSFSRKSKSRFPWLPLILLLLSIYFFWIYPRQRGPVPVKVQFMNTGKTAPPRK